MYLNGIGAVTQSATDGLPCEVSQLGVEVVEVQRSA
jgi:hypothetical protein